MTELETRLFPDVANPGSLAARIVCPRCKLWTPLDARICLMCGRPLPWKVIYWPQIVAERQRRGLIDWVNEREIHGVVVEGHHFDWGDPITKILEADI